jgi:hypothetical protein
MLKLIGIIALVYIGWATGIIQTVLLLTAAVLTTVAGI